MAKILSAAAFAARLAAGETVEAIFGAAGVAPAIKLVSPTMATIGEVNDAERAVKFIISTEAVDRYTDSIKLGGWQLDDYRRNNVVLWAHDDSIPAIARGENVVIEGGALRSTAIFATKDQHPLADTIYQLVKGGFIKASSVGFIPLEAKASTDPQRRAGYNITRQALLEWSVVNIPANPETLVAAKSLGIDTQPLFSWAEKVLDLGDFAVIAKSDLEILRREAKMPVGQRAKRSVTEVETVIRGRLKIAEKSMWTVSDLAIVVQMLAGMAKRLSADESGVADAVTGAVKTLGQALIDLAAEEVADLLDGEVDSDPMYYSLTPDLGDAFRLLRKLPDAAIGGIVAAMRGVVAGRKIAIVDKGVEAPIVATRAGRVLSAKNEKAIREAHAAITAGCESLRSAVDDMTAPDGEAATKTATDATARAERVAEAEAIRTRAKTT